MYKRIRILSISFLIILGMLTLRVAYIQVLGHEELSAVAETQQSIVLEGADSRGIIYDRNGTPIAGGHQEYVYIIRTEKYDGETQNALNKVNAEEIHNESQEYKVFSSQIYNKNIGERLRNNSDAYVLETERRYTTRQPAVHMIGYINPKDCSGASGLEMMYNNELNLLDKKVSAVADVNGKLLQGYGLTVKTAADKDAFVKDGIVTTLDIRIQKEAERILDGINQDGAIIVAKAATGEIVAAASTPVFDPEKINEYIDSKNGELVNKVTQGQYPPGSVFKIVVAAAALEYGINPEKKLECKGTETVNGHTVKCQTGGESGHGIITFKQAFADSCNSAFIQLGQQVGADAVIEMAKRFGLGETVIEGFPGEQKGHIMTLKESEGAAIANLSIGQGENLVTPLQVTAMTSIVANDGIYPNIKITDTDKTSEVECIAPDVAADLQEMMKEVTVNGTGSALELPVNAGAKTGSAESMQSGKSVVHGWMTGYVPAEDPEFVITAFVEDGKSGRGSAGPLFVQISEYLHEHNMFMYETNF